MLKAEFGHKAKGVVIKVAHGGSVPKVDNPEVASFLTCISSEARYLRWLACSSLPEVHEGLVGDKAEGQTNDAKDSWPEATCFHFFWTTVENKVLLTWVQWVAGGPLRHLSLHYDGLLVDRARCQASADFKAESEAFIETDTQYKVTLIAKANMSFLQGLESRGVQMPRLSLDCPHVDTLTKQGNGILLAMGHLTGNYSDFAAVASRDNPTGAHLLTYKAYCKSGKGSSALRPPVLTPTFGLHLPADGAVVVHTDHGVTPHCFVLRRAGGALFHLLNGVDVLEVQEANVLDAFSDATDASSVVSFAFRLGGDGGLHKALLDLSAE